MDEIVEGVGPDAEVYVNAKGGRQSASPYRCDLFPPTAYLHIAKILASGAAKYGENNWLDVTFAEHINHALVHVKAYGAGDRSDDHIGHAACRMMMALEIHIDEKREAAKHKFGFGKDVTP